MTARRKIGIRGVRRLIIGGVIGAGRADRARPTGERGDHGFLLGRACSPCSVTALDNTIAISRNAAGTILVNGGAVAVTGGTPTVANTALIQVFGQGGNDTITLNEAQRGAAAGEPVRRRRQRHASPAARAATCCSARSDNDTLLGKGGFDFLFGGSRERHPHRRRRRRPGVRRERQRPDDLEPRRRHRPQRGRRRRPTPSRSTAATAPRSFTATANGTRVRFDRIDPAPFAIDIGTSEQLVLNANGGDDSFSATGNLASLIGITVDGGAGNDTILGSNGVDLLLGGDGNDFVDGQQGNDVAFLGAGDDDFQWDPGDGSDTVEGQDGNDKLLFNGSAGDEIFVASANGGRLRFTRNLGNIVMDTDDVEAVDLRALGGADTLTVNDLSGTDVVSVDTDLAGTLGGTAGDAQADTVIVNGTNGDDIVDVFGAGTSASVVGLAAQVNITNSEGANDSLVINTLGGEDGVTATTLPAGVIKLTVDGGAGSDTLLGSQGADVFLGGDGNDFIFGDNGNDLALMGANDDVFQWDPGDGNDTLEGQDGTDTMLFFGANVAENIDIVRQRRSRALHPQHRQRDHGPRRRRETSTSGRWAAPTTSSSAT